MKILNEDGVAIAQPWFEISGSSHASAFNSTGYRTSSPWTSWSWAAPAESDFSLILGVTTSCDNNMPSYGFFDDICIKASTIAGIPTFSPKLSWIALDFPPSENPSSYDCPSTVPLS